MWKNPKRYFTKPSDLERDMPVVCGIAITSFIVLMIPVIVALWTGNV